MILGEAFCSCHSLLGQHVQLKTWLSRVRYYTVPSLLLSLKAEHSRRGQQNTTVSRGPGTLCRLHCRGAPSVQKAPRQQQVKGGLQSLWLSEAHCED